MPETEAISLPDLEFSFHKSGTGVVLGSNAGKVWTLSKVWKPTAKVMSSIFSPHDDLPPAIPNVNISIEDYIYRYRHPYSAYSECLSLFSKQVEAEHNDIESKVAVQEASSSSQALISHRKDIFAQRQEILYKFTRILLRFTQKHLLTFKELYAETNERYRGFRPSETPCFQSWIEPFKCGIEHMILETHCRIMAESFSSMVRLANMTTGIVKRSSVMYAKAKGSNYLEQGELISRSVRQARRAVETDPSCPRDWESMSLKDIVNEYLLLHPKRRRKKGGMTPSETVDDKVSLFKPIAIKCNKMSSVLSFKPLGTSMMNTKKETDPWKRKEGLVWADDLEEALGKGNLSNFEVQIECGCHDLIRR